MGKRYMNFAPYMMTIFACSLIGSLIGLVGLRSTTQDFNTTLTWALATAFFIHYVGFKYSGFVGYLKSFTEPVKLLTPINLIGIATTPMSMSLRHFGNVLGGRLVDFAGNCLSYRLTGSFVLLAAACVIFVLLWQEHKERRTSL